MERRAFLGGAAVAGAALWGPGASAAELGRRIEAQVEDVRARWEGRRRLVLEQTPEAADAVTAAGREMMGRALGALGALKDIEAIAVEDQPHPAVQALIRDAAAAVGEGAVACKGWIAEFLAQQEGADRAGEAREAAAGWAHLRAALRAVRESVADWRVEGRRLHALELTLEELGRDDASPVALRKRLEKELRRAERAEALAAEMATRDTGLLDVGDVEVERRFRVGMARWRGGVEGAEGEEELPLPSAANEPNTGKVLLGLLLLGGALIAGLFVMFLGFCIAACGAVPVGGLFVFLVGLAMLILGSVRGVRLMIEGSGGPDARRVDAGGAGVLGARRVVEARACSVRAQDGWVGTGLARDGRLVVIEASGMLRHPNRWFSDADGSPIAEVPGSPLRVQGAPPGALLGRVGEEVFFIGRGGAVPEGAPGPIELAINTAAPCIGHLLAQITVIEARAEA